PDRASIPFCSLTPRFLLLLLHGRAPTASSALSLHDALPIFLAAPDHEADARVGHAVLVAGDVDRDHARVAEVPLQVREWDFRNPDRKSTRLNSSHVSISYAVFCLKKKNLAHASRPSRIQTTY